MPNTGPRFLARFPHEAAPQRTHGVGFLVAEQHVLTCAHVVNLALGRDRRAQNPPTELVDLEFPLADDAFCRAQVTRWEPPPPSGIRGSEGADIAGLVIVRGKPPPGVTPARLTSGVSAGCQVDVFGCPDGVTRRPDGVWAPGRVAGVVGGELLQIDADRDAAWQAQPGFSGSPVIDRASGAVIGMFKAASTHDEHRESYAIPTSVLCAAWADVLVVLPPNPYKGLAAFTPADAELFLGRDAERAELLSKVRQHPFVLVVGPSGVGKSSLVQAGLIPELSKDGWAWVMCRPSEHPDPFHTLAAALRRVGGAAGADIDKHRAWVDEIRADGLARLAADLRVASGRRTLLVVDQLEELFHVQDGLLVAPFLERLLELPEALAGEHPLAVVATLRADFYHRLLGHTDAGPRLANRRIDLSPLGEAALREVIEIPARAREVHYVDHLVDRIITETSTSEGALPLLEFALTELWSHQRRGRLGHEAYHEIGGVLGSLDREGEHAVGQLLGSGVSERDIERTLIALISSSGREDIPATRRSCPADELDGTQRRVAEALTRARLLTATQRNQQACYELAHEALIGSWQRLNRAAEADGEFLRWRTRLEQWDEQRDGLPPETWVAEGTRWCAQRDDIPARLVDLVRRSQDELQRRVHQLRQAHRRAEALRLAAQAQMELIRATGLTVALALTAESLDLEHTLAGDSAARAALRLAPRPVSSLAHDGPVYEVVFSPDGAWVATASDDGTARVFAVGTAKLRAAVVARMLRPLTDAEWQRYGGRPSEL
jgi:energy-coupling factor transporter ATP-binding protein EcfA2